MNERQIMVTGGAGYIGTHVVRDLCRKGYRVIVVDNMSTGNLDLLPGGEFFQVDIGDTEGMANVFRRFDISALLHFAAFIEVEESMRDPLKYYENNSLKTIQLIQNSVAHGVKWFLFSSTAAVYGIPEKIPIGEDSALLPINPYGRSKLISETVLKDVSDAYPCFRYVSLRYFNVAGADRDSRIGQRYKNPTHLITRSLKTAAGVYPKLDLFGTDYPTFDGTAVRDFIHVDDLSRAHIEALKYLESGGKSRIFNCGIGRGFSVKEVIESAKRVTGIDFPVHPVSRRAGDPPILIADPTRIQRDLAWKPEYLDLDEIVTTAWNWERKEQFRLRQARNKK